MNLTSTQTAVVATSTGVADASGSARGWIRRRADATPRSAWVLADQGVVSLTNFFAAVLVGRIAGESALGAFGLGFGTVVLLFAVAKALVWTPYTTTSPHLSSAERRSFAGSVTLHLAVIASAACVLTAVVACLPGLGEYRWMLLCAAAYQPVMLFREHVRRICLAKLDVIELTIFDLAACALQVVALLAFARLGWLNGATVFLALSIAALASAVWYAARRARFAFSIASAGADWRRNWPFSRWIAGGAAAVQGGEQGVRWVVSAIHGLAVMGQLAAAQWIIQFANPIVIGVSNYFGPASANTYSEQGLKGLWRQTVRGSLLLAAFAAGMSLLLVTVGPLIAEVLFAGQVANVNSLLVGSLALGVFSTVVHIPIEFASLARSRGRLLFVTAMIRLAVNATVGVGLIWRFGAVGVGIGMLIGNVISLAIQWTALIREVRHA